MSVRHGDFLREIKGYCTRIVEAVAKNRGFCKFTETVRWVGRRDQISRDEVSARIFFISLLIIGLNSQLLFYFACLR